MLHICLRHSPVITPAVTNKNSVRIALNQGRRKSTVRPDFKHVVDVPDESFQARTLYVPATIVVSSISRLRLRPDRNIVIKRWEEGGEAPR